jgi:hypothetical protein
MNKLIGCHPFVDFQVDEPPEGSFFKEVLGMISRLGASWCLRNGGTSANFAPATGANFSVGAKIRLKKLPS